MVALSESFNYDGEDEPGMVDTRDRRMNLDTGNACRDCQDLVVMAKPQGGVDAMAGMFLNATSPAPGIRDNGDATAKPVPSFGMRAPHHRALIAPIADVLYGRRLRSARDG